MKKINSKIIVKSGTSNSISNAARESVGGDQRQKPHSTFDGEKQNATGQQSLLVLSQNSVDSRQNYYSIESSPDRYVNIKINAPSPTRLKKQPKS